MDRETISDDFILPDEIPMDRSHTLDQLTSRFRGVKDGLPELVKNSKDQYSRHGVVDRAARQIVVLASTATHRLGVLDFAGARSSDFDGWTTWSSRTAGRAELSDDIEAGHGNGGKAFMVRGATNYAFLESCFESKRTRMGFKNQRQADLYKPGYGVEAGIRLNNVAEPNATSKLERFLAHFGMSMRELPERARAVFKARNAYTGALLSGVADWDNRRKNKVRRLAEEVIAEILASHGQTAMTVETCEVWVVVDGKLITAQPIAPLVLEPFPGFETPRQFEIPDILPDPETGDPVDMVCGASGPRYLKLQTSAKQMQLSDETKARNVIRVWNARNNVATWPLQSLGVLMTPVSFIFGEIRCPAITGAHLGGAERIHLSDTPLVRALREWTRQKVEELAEDLHKAMMAENKPRDRAQARSVLQSIRDLMRQYLDPDAAAEGDDDEHDEGGPGDGRGYKRKRKKQPFGSRVDEIILEAGKDKIAFAAGTASLLRVKCVERQADGSTKPVKASNLQFCSDNGGVTFDAAGHASGTAAGKSKIWVECGKVTSNEVECEIVTATDVSVLVPAEILLQGQVLNLPITFTTPSGPRNDLLIDGSIDEPGMGLLGRSGRFTAGFKEGQATIRIRYGNSPQHQRTTVIQIGPERVPPTDSKGARGSDIPEILLCGDEAPGMDDFPPEQRTLPGGEELPTIIEDPLFPHVVWINPTSKESMRVRRNRGGSTGVSSIGTRNFAHFVALKCFDVLKRLHVRQALRGRTVTEYEFIQLAAFAEIECANFIDAAWELSDELLAKSEAFNPQDV